VVSAIVLAAGTDWHWGVIAAVVVAAVAVGLNVWQVILTRRALGAAREATQEALKARVDQQAPRVVVRRIDRDPYVWYPSTTDGEPNPAKTAVQQQFQVPRQDAEPLFIRVDMFLRNEGASSAWVNRPAVDFLTWPASGQGRARFVAPDEDTSLPMHLRPQLPDTLPIAAGQEPEWWLRVELQCPLGEWVKLGGVEAELAIRVVDAREPGIEDRIPVTIAASPFMGDVNNAGRIIVRQGLLDREPEPPLVKCWFTRATRRYSWEPAE
jgi:hypothetical protein